MPNSSITSSSAQLPEATPPANWRDLLLEATKPRKQAVWLWVTPMAAILAFAIVMTLLFYTLQHGELEKREQTLSRDIEYTQQILRSKLLGTEDRLSILARELALSSIDESQFGATVRELQVANVEVVLVSWQDVNRKVRWVVTSPVGPPETYRQRLSTVDGPEAYWAFDEARIAQRPTYTRAFLGPDNDVYIELHVPIFSAGRFAGTVSAIYSLNRLLIYQVPREVAARHKVALVDEGGNWLTSTSPRMSHDENMSYELALDPPGKGLKLRGYSLGAGSLQNRLLWTLVFGLSAFIMWSLILLARYSRRRVDAEFARDRLFSLSMDLQCVIDRDAKFVRVNPAFQRVLGLTDDAATAMTLIDLVHVQDQATVKSWIDRLLSGEVNWTGASFEARCRTGDGRWRWLSWGVSIDLHADPGSALLYGVAHDVTERRNAEAALAVEIAFRRAMENSMSTGMRAIDMKGRITYVNPAFCRMTGYSERELIGIGPPFPYWPKNHHTHHEDNLRRILAGDVPRGGLEVKIQHRDGGMFDARMYVSALIDHQGVQTGWMTSVTDITEQKRISEELEAAHDRFVKVLESLDAAVAVIREDHGTRDLLFANRYYRQLFGNDAAPLLDQAKERSESAAVNAEVFVPALSAWFDLRRSRLPWVDGFEVNLLIATDVSARKEAQEIQRQQAERLQHTGRLVTMGEMASSLAHELNQPLTAIANYSMGTAARVKAMASRGNPIDPAGLLEALHKTAQQAERAGEVIKRIRAFVRRSEPNRSEADLGHLIHEAIELVSAEAVKRRIGIFRDPLPKLPRLEVDPVLLTQVLMNLLKNAIDAQRQAGRGEIRVSVQLGEDAVTVRVADRGPGISPEAAAKLFEPFFTTKDDGMGMGLNICRSIVESHQGRLWFEPNQPQGAVFFLRLPLTHPLERKTEPIAAAQD